MRFFRPGTVLLVTLLTLFSTACFSLERQSNAIYQSRREALAHELHGGVALLFGNNEPFMEYQDFRQDEDFYYLTGWNEPGAALIVADAVPASNGKPASPYQETLLLPERNLHAELFTGVKLDAASPDRVRVTGVSEVRSMRDLPSILGQRGMRNIWSPARRRTGQGCPCLQRKYAGQQ